MNDPDVDLASQQQISARRFETLRQLSLVGEDRNNVEGASEAVARAFAANPRDVPFASLYLTNRAGTHALRSALVGLPEGAELFPSAISLEESSDQPWPFAAALENLQVIEVNLTSKHIRIDSTISPAEFVHQAFVLPMASSVRNRVTGFLIAGASSRQVLDQPYRTFFNLAAELIGGAFSKVRNSEDEKWRAEMLSEIDRRRIAFFTNISHELRTPLTLMLGPLEDVLEHAYVFSPDDRERLQTVRRNSVRLLKLANTLLDFSHIEAGRVRASFQPTQLGDFTTELASVFRSTIEAAGLELLIDCPDIDEPICVDRGMWEKIVLNLVSNAFKFTFDGQIEVSLHRSGTSVVFAVRDTGAGIPKHELPLLFTRFHRVKSVAGRSYEGSGYGLALVQDLVKLHGGCIRVESELGKGSVFTVEVPLGLKHLPPGQIGADEPLTSLQRGGAYVTEATQWLSPGADTQTASPRSVGDNSAVRPPPVILIADNNADMRNYVSRLLGERYEIVAASDGETALEIVGSRSPELVISDIMMPRLDGFGFLRALRQNPLTRTIPVILLSARAGEDPLVEGLQAGADDYLAKPFSARELLARVDAALRLARVRREAQERIVNIWESISDGIVILDRDWHYIYINSAAGKMGLDRSKLLGKTLWDAFPELIGTEVEGKFRSASINREHVEFETHFAPGDRWFNNRVFPSEDGNIAVYFRDVTDRKRAEEERAQLFESEREARRRAEESSRLRDEFLATLSHELRTPLNSINGWVHLLRSGKLTPAQARRALETIERSAKSQKQVINDLLDVSKIITGKMLLEVTRVSLSRVIESEIDIVRPAAEAKGIQFNIQLDSSIAPILGDAERLQQVVWNVLSNAVKFSPIGGHVDVLLVRKDSAVEISVRDDGQGIGPEFLPHVFDRFTQEDSGTTRQHPGLGLGLAIVRHLVELHGGTVRAESPGENLGSTFTITLSQGRAGAGTPVRKIRELTDSVQMTGRYEGHEPANAIDKERLG